MTLLCFPHHGIFHVVACVGYDGHDGVGAAGVVVQVVVVVHVGPDQRALRGLEPVQLVIWAIHERVQGETHSLLTWEEKEFNLW